MPAFFPENNTALPSDDAQRSLIKIVSLGGGVGASGGTQQVYIGRDPAAPDNAAFPAINYTAGGGPITQWDVLSQAWT